MFRVACVQNCATEDMAANIAQATALVEAARGDGANLICLPEYFSCLEPSDSLYVARGHFEDRHPALPHFRELAARLKAWILLGSLCIRISEDKVNNRSYLLNGNGDVAAVYNKVHLFDAALPRGETYHESRTVEPGAQTRVAATPWGALGLTICYDLRFPYLYRALAKAGAAFIAVPSTFTQTTGEAHWHVLLRARAIETGCFIFAPGQCGVRPWGRAAYGHSLIVDPWGTVLADGGTEVGYITADIDPTVVEAVRRRVPALQHDRQLDVWQ
jgi:predicted amidohydrolase